MEPRHGLRAAMTARTERRRPRAAPAVAAGARSGRARNNSGSLAMFTAMREAFRG